MTDILRSFFEQHDTAFLIVAAMTCVLTSAILSMLFRMKPFVERDWQITWGSSVILVSGIGVWTTHFVAMLGYRPDLALTFALDETLLSALSALLFVGAPLVLSARVNSSLVSVFFGGAAGFGIWLMHYIGTLALDGCTIEQAASGSLLSMFAGIAFLATGTALRRSANGPAAFAILFTLAVAATHGIAVTATSLTAAFGYASHDDNRRLIGSGTAVGAIVLLVALFNATKLLKRVQAQQDDHNSILSTALQNMSNGLLCFDRSGHLRIFNQQYMEIFGLGPNALSLGMTRKDIVTAVGNAHSWSPQRRELAQKRADMWMAAPNNTPIEFIMDDGRTMKLEVRGLGGGGLVLTYDDLTAERAAQNLLSLAAMSDELTGLPNRRHFNQKLAADFDKSIPFALILVDLDRLKNVNDTYGHFFGDQLIQQFSSRIGSLANSDVFAARLGGDELAVLCRGDINSITTLAETIIGSASKPFVVGGKTIHLTCSVGVCGSEEASTAVELLQFADLALYEAKRSGRGLTKFYTSGSRETFEKRVVMEIELRGALRNHQLAIAYQPVVRLADREVIGHEALIRWNSPKLGAVSPAVFIPLAEECGLMDEIGRWVMMQACLSMSERPSYEYVAVNISPVQVASGTLETDVLAALMKAGLAPCRLELELTETAMVADNLAMAETLLNLKALGVKIAMDDFGTGYSSLAYLRDFPLDRIKIDRSFVSRAQNEPASCAILRGIVQIAKEMSVSTLAEGVENESQIDLLVAVGCNDCQGYYFGRPELRLPTYSTAVA